MLLGVGSHFWVSEASHWALQLDSLQQLWHVSENSGAH